jgi:hypothetical protein
MYNSGRPAATWRLVKQGGDGNDPDEGRCRTTDSPKVTVDGQGGLKDRWHSINNSRVSPMRTAPKGAWDWRSAIGGPRMRPIRVGVRAARLILRARCTACETENEVTLPVLAGVPIPCSGCGRRMPVDSEVINRVVELEAEYRAQR